MTFGATSSLSEPRRASWADDSVCAAALSRCDPTLLASAGLFGTTAGTLAPGRATGSADEPRLHLRHRLGVILGAREEMAVNVKGHADGAVTHQRLNAFW